ncbi:UDP-N-acetylmuramoyl-tripeptide--D-alanyl-D-alanine ligase [Marinomonas fungiae]|uniref:UDP-N-acetylmuramoyl-tripeptide--D-alanyl-D-alanine ligase n=1 Tax=Marinomonas fungiae TaxID=1137284 RepID=A0A0K6IRB4_9GAMM|nr:UDP-N-acetylmuramoyl-tripeptide--D-alanyl-D-alanine ligase [Marinomonas fungiae]CUB05877.1 UDP-N-acetylmuramoyl-tripeptide--D-alanyl-D-alanine ligase [Marinomonas fungiae]
MLQKLKLSDIANVVGGRLIGQDAVVMDVSTDSREVLEQKLFVALVGERFNGHQFTDLVMQQGATAVLVSEPVTATPRIEVEDTAQAYALIGRMVRRLFTGPVVAITGSNGKTSVKDWLARVLSEHGQVLKTQSNLNNQIGVPKTLLNLSAADQYAVIEAGTSFPGEIEKLGQTIEADVVVLTNASGSHLLGFGSIQGIAIEKGMLFETAKPNATVVLNADDASYDYWLGRVGEREVRSFSFTDPSATLYAKTVQETVSGSNTTLVYRDETYRLTLDRPGKHHIANAMAVALAMTALGFALIDVVAQLKHPEQVPGRMELLTSKNEAVVINDCYNASPKSVEAAIDVLALYANQTKWMVLGALGELGDQETAIHLGLGEYAAQSGIEHLITIGPIAAHAGEGFMQTKTSEQQVHPCQTKDEALAILAALNSEHVILVKGSRSARMEDIVNALKN